MRECLTKLKFEIAEAE